MAYTYKSMFICRVYPCIYNLYKSRIYSIAVVMQNSLLYLEILHNYHSFKSYFYHFHCIFEELIYSMEEFKHIVYYPLKRVIERYTHFKI